MAMNSNDTPGMQALAITATVPREILDNVLATLNFILPGATVDTADDDTPDGVVLTITTSITTSIPGQILDSVLASLNIVLPGANVEVG